MLRKVFNYNWCLITLVLNFCVGLRTKYGSPCPKVFQYKNNGDKWSGLIEVPSPKIGDTVKLDVQITIRALLDEVRRRKLYF